MPDLVHVNAMRKTGKTAKGNTTDKLWAAVLLRHSATSDQFVSVWGPVTGPIHVTAQLTTYAHSAAFQYQTAVSQKQANGYQPVGWAAFPKLASKINALTKTVAVAPPTVVLKPNDEQGYSFTIEQMNAIAKSAKGGGLTITGYYSGTSAQAYVIPETANCAFCMESKALDEKTVCKCGHSRSLWHHFHHGLNQYGFHACLHGNCDCKQYAARPQAVPHAPKGNFGVEAAPAVPGKLLDLPCDCTHWLNVHATKALDPNIGCLVSTCNCEYYRRSCLECFEITRNQWRHSATCVTGRREKPKQQEDQLPARQPRRISHLLPDDL